MTPPEAGPRPVTSPAPSRRAAMLWGVSLGEAALAAFVLCAVSGVLLVPAFDVRDGARSIAEWLLANPGATVLRNLHYWTAQACALLSALHLWDHLRRGTERRPAAGVWWRLVASVPVLAWLMLSGFLLRADADALQARRILEQVLGLVPGLGAPATALLFGAEEGALLGVYLHHAATATLIVWLIVAEHARRLWGGARAMLLVAGSAGALALLLGPGLHDGRDPAVKGPWYFQGLQELLHWLPWPVVAVGLLAALLALLAALPRLRPAAARRTKVGLAVLAAGYLLTCALALTLRGENWRWRADGPAWPAGAGDWRAGPLLARAGVDPGRGALPIVLGRPEGCMACHARMQGFSPAHRPEAIGCASCHGGDSLTLDPRRAHAGLVRVPGNLADASRSCGQSACHVDIVPRVERSVMATFAGVIATNRRVFGEGEGEGAHAAAASAPAGQQVHQPTQAPPQVHGLGHGAADSHLRQLCVGCHLGQEKTLWGPITQDSRGGGCNACHLKYDAAAAKALAAYVPEPPDWNADGSPPRPPPPSGKPLPEVHPRLSVQADGSHCFGCHSRSSRISTSYEGWHELQQDPGETALQAAPARYRQLDDGRYFERRSADLHHAAGLDCIDCHTALEVMGNGQAVARKAEALRVRCEDCHAAPGARLASVAPAAVDPESRKILALRGWGFGPGERVGTTRSGDTLLNVVVDGAGRGQLRRKADGRRSPLKPQAATCAQAGAQGGAQGAGHARLSCASCHTAWAPQCTSCHTAFDPAGKGHDHLSARWMAGEWVETAGAFDAGLPPLGVRLANGHGEPGGERVDTFVPGMILTIDRNQQPGGKPDVVFRRLFAPTAAHTTQRQARACTSCHNDPVALGYGQGTLRFEPGARGAAKGGGGQIGRPGQWRFTPARPASAPDGLPEDAWTGFLAERRGMVSTQAGARPFTLAEQQRILTVGACLSCHPGNSAVMQASLRDFGALLARRKAQCAAPDWRAR